MNNGILKKNATLIIGISIPILMIIFVAVSIYLPGLFVKPKFNFVYVTGNDYYYYSQYQYAVQNGKIVENEIKKPENRSYEPAREVRLYMHDVAANTNREITFEEARNMNLDSNIKSPDGFEIITGSHSGGFLFSGGSDYDTRYLTGNNISKKLDLRLVGSSYYNNFRFIGWIK
jgi:hypothetical protein